MKLTIKNTKEYVGLEAYIKEWLVPSIRLYIWSKFNPKMLKNYSHIYNEAQLINYIKAALYSIEMVKVGYPQSHQYEIRINPNVFCESKTAKLYDICCLVNYGSLSCPAYPVFTESFNFFATNFWKFYKLYQLGVLKNNGRKII